MKLIGFAPFTICFILLAACSENRSPGLEAGRGEAGPAILAWSGDAESEIDDKIGRLMSFLEAEHLDGMVFGQTRNIAWITAGLSNTKLELDRPEGSAFLLILQDGRRMVLCRRGDEASLISECLGRFGYQPQVFPWFEPGTVPEAMAGLLRKIAGKRRLGSDTDIPGTINVNRRFASCRYVLTSSELSRYRTLGQAVALAAEETARGIRPGLNEYEIESAAARALWRYGIRPVVLLAAVDEQLSDSGPALPGGAVLQRFAMIGVTGEKWGLSATASRMVHFGPLPAELAAGQERAAVLAARIQLASRPGTKAGVLFQQIQEWYAAAGQGDGRAGQPSGGATGYRTAEWLVSPGLDETIREHQAFFWNPVLAGIRMAGTLITTAAGPEIITRGGSSWPQLDVELDGRLFPQPAILVCDPGTGRPLARTSRRIKP